MALADRPADERAALAYCAPRGVPLSVFLGRVVYPGDPWWLPEDTAAALDWLADQEARCSGCGLSTAETTREDAEGAWDVEGLRCHACKAIGDEQEAFGRDGSLVGMLWRLRRRKEG